MIIRLLLIAALVGCGESPKPAGKLLSEDIAMTRRALKDIEKRADDLCRQLGIERECNEAVERGSGINVR